MSNRTEALKDAAADALDSDARLRAELRRKDKALRDAVAALQFRWGATHEEVCRVNVAAFKILRDAALKKPTRRKKP